MGQEQNDGFGLANTTRDGPVLVLAAEECQEALATGSWVCVLFCLISISYCSFIVVCARHL